MNTGAVVLAASWLRPSAASRGHRLFLLPGVMKRWVVECNHGCMDKAPASKLSSKWHETGPIDPVKAILIMNEQE
jgi:hypothetical protein